MIRNMISECGFASEYACVLDTESVVRSFITPEQPKIKYLQHQDGGLQNEPN